MTTQVSHENRLTAELILTEAIFQARDALSAEDFGLALRRARTAVAPALADAERLAVIRALLAFADDYDGAPYDHDSTGPSFTPYAAAGDVGMYLVTGRLAQRDSLPRLRFELEDAAESYPEHRATFEAAVRMLGCGSCNGEGVVAVNTHGSGEDAIEQECETCHGRGAACGDCAPFSEDRDELRPRGAVSETLRGAW